MHISSLAAAEKNPYFQDLISNLKDDLQKLNSDLKQAGSPDPDGTSDSSNQNSSF